MDHYQQLITLIKQSKWIDGVLLALNSKTAHELFLNSSLQERFRFIRDHMALAFRIEGNSSPDQNDGG